MFAALEAAKEAASSGRWDEALEQFELALRRVAVEGTAADASEILRRLGNLRVLRGEMEVASELLETSRVIAERNGLDGHLASALIGLAVVAQRRGDLVQAQWQYEQGQALAEALGDERLVTIAEQNLATLDNIRGDVEGALLRYEQALERSLRSGDLVTAAHARNNMGMANVDLGRWAEAAECYRESERLAREVGDARMEARVVLNRVEMFLAQRSFEQARDACAAACEMLNRLGAVAGLAEAHKFYGMLYRETGHLKLADAHLLRARALAGRCEDRLLEGETESELALLRAKEERWDEAREALTRALWILGGLDARREVRELEGRLKELDARIPSVPL